MKLNNNKIAPLCAIAVLLVATLSCDLDQNETKETIRDQFYVFDPSSILESIDEGKIDIFSPVSEQPELPLPSQQVPVTWNQADYLQIIDTLYEHVWDETPTGWNINNMGFLLGCDNVEHGLQNGSFDFFKVVKTGERESRMTRFIDIDPRSNSAYISESEYYPKLVDWIPIDLLKIKISASDALQIVEINGGKEKRLEVGNSCDISLSFSPSSVSIYGWRVRYTKSNRGGEIVYLEVDPFTGEYK